VAIAASLGRATDKARIEQMLQQSALDKIKLEIFCSEPALPAFRIMANRLSGLSYSRSVE
jgi:hypothetical protein